MKRAALLVMLSACGAPPVATPTGPAATTLPAPASAPILAPVVPPGCAAILAGPDPGTVDGLRDVLLCERLTAAAALQRAALGAREIQADLEGHDPPSRVLWLSIGAAAVLLAVGGAEVAW